MRKLKKLTAVLTAIVTLVTGTSMLSIQALADDTLAGDVNADGEVTITDAVMMYKYILRKGTLSADEWKNADMNADSKVNVVDMYYIKEKLLSEGVTDFSAIDLCANLLVDSVEGKDADDEFISSQTDFAINLFKEENAGDKDNVLVSPYSVEQALAMTANGAKGNTKTEMEAVLGGGMDIDDLNKYLYTERTSQNIDDYAKLLTANSIWYRDSEYFIPNADFLRTNVDYYGASAYKAPFDDSTVKDINSWVNKNTDGMIPEIISFLDESSEMVLANAVTFDAEWWEDMDSVKNRDFTNENGTTSNIDMMSSTTSKYISDDDTTGFVVNYKGNKYAFVAMLPDESISIDDYVAELTGEKFSNLLENKETATVNLLMPQFSYDYDTDLTGSLSDMGMSDAFSVDADFTGMLDDTSAVDNLYIGGVIHKTHIEVNTAGTRAAAATAVMMETCSVPINPKNVNLTRPFVYSIIDTDTNIPIFIGTVTNLA